MRAGTAGYGCGSIACNHSRYALVVATGARAYTRAVSTGIFGRPVDHIPGPAISTAVRLLLHAMRPLVVSALEQLPLGPSITLSRRVEDGALGPSEPLEAYKTAKDAFYREAGLDHWTKTLVPDERWADDGF